MPSLQDTIQGFIFDNADIRGQLVHLNETRDKILSPHQYPKQIEMLLTEVLLSATLMSATIKFSGQLTIQFQSKGILQLLLVKCDHEFKVRALAQYEDDDDIDEAALNECLQNGSLVVTIEADKNNKPYQSIVPIKGTIKDSLIYYFHQSEQLPTDFWFAVSDEQAVGMLLQQVPDKLQAENREAIWQEVNLLADSLKIDELLALDNETILYRLFHEHTLRLFDPKLVRFYCPCNRSKMLEAVKIMGEEEVDNLFKTHKTIDVTCEFCREYYAFDKLDTNYLFKSQ